MSATGLILIASIVGGLVLLLVVIQLISKAAAASVRENIARRFPSDAIVLQDDLANNFGRTKKGVLQARGSGGLVLTREAVHFLSLAGEDVVIPLQAITAITTAKSHLGKTVGRPLLKIDFEGDSIAFLVRDLDAWRARLEQQRVASN